MLFTIFIGLVINIETKNLLYNKLNKNLRNERVKTEICIEN